MSSMETARLPIFIGDAQIGSALPAHAALCPAAAQLRITHNGFHLPQAGTACNRALALWADALHTAGLLRAWRNERLSVAALPPAHECLTQLPQPLACLERGAARVLGVLTHAVHLVGLAPNGDVWLQRRALTKSTDPGLWDTLSGGLLAAQDTLHSGMLRETYEEAGLLEGDLSAVQVHGAVQQRRSVPDGLILEAVWTYSAVVNPNANPKNLDGEVMAFACVSRHTLAEKVRAGLVSHEAVLALRMAGVLAD